MKIFDAGLYSLVSALIPALRFLIETVVLLSSYISLMILLVEGDTFDRLGLNFTYGRERQTNSSAGSGC